MVLWFFSLGLAAQAANFHQVSPDVYRGAAPGPDGVKALASLGIKTILNLQTSDDAVDEEAGLAAAAGIRYISKKLPPLTFKPTESRMESILQILKDPASYPLYVHCRHGEDRTGTVIGLYRVFVQGWSAQSAYLEMLAYNFHPEWEAGLKCYFEKKTGMKYSSACNLIPAYDPD